jgi:type II secretion system protein G
LIELLVVVAIIGILAAIAIANYLNALTRARQKRTMADMRTIALAWDQRNSEKNSFSPGFTFPTSAVTFAELEKALTPTYLKSLPKMDAWGRPFEFAYGTQVYGVRSAGRDGTYEGTNYEPNSFDSPDCDIVYANGNFVRYPAHIQKQ